MLQIGVPRSEKITDSGMTVPAAMGVATALNLMHFWAHDEAVKLAKGLRAALDNTNSEK